VRITLIAAVAENGVIGKDGDLPWRLPADLAFFQRTTLGHAMLMGRRTYESTGALPGRTTIVLSRSGPPFQEDAGEGGEGEGGDRLHWAGGYVEGVAKAKQLGVDELFVCGGAGVYRQALADPEAERMILTRVAASPEGDTKFPEVQWGDWELESRDEHPADARHPYAYAFETWVRRGAIPPGVNPRPRRRP
jgi:dihydrofolate reductase